MIGCDCEVCTSPNPQDKRLRSSIMVETPNTTIIVDSGPDFRYQMLRISEMPKMDVHLTPDGKGWGGLGEIAVGPVKAALTNAIYNAGGPRLRSQPLKNENIVKRA